MIGVEWLAVIIKGEHCIVVVEHLQGDVGGKVVFAMSHDMGGGGVDREVLDKFAPGNACPGGVEFAPACDTVDVYRFSLGGQRPELTPGEDFFLLDEAKDA